MIRVAESQADWSKLAEQAAAGEVVVIERPSGGNVEMRAAPPPGRPDQYRSDMTWEEFNAWLDEVSYDPGPDAPDLTTMMRRMRGYDD
jgi:hypothetical protein